MSDNGYNLGAFSWLMLAMRGNAAEEMDSLIHTMIHLCILRRACLVGGFYQEDAKYLSLYVFVCI